jgi:hypothetical protein
VALRYRCYRAEGLIDPRTPNEVFLDEFDHAPGAQVFGVRLPQGRIVSSIRLHILRNDDHASSATREAFSDILRPMIAAGKTLVDGARFVVDPDDRLGAAFDRVADAQDLPAGRR